MIIRHYLVSGKVQGVGYRQFTLKQALAIGLKGRVRNLVDGRVEIVAAGSETQIRPFEAMLAKGPKLSAIEGIERNELSTEQIAKVSDIAPCLETDFQILSDGSGSWRF